MWNSMLRQQMDPDQGRRFDAFSSAVLSRNIVNRVSQPILQFSAMFIVPSRQPEQ